MIIDFLKRDWFEEVWRKREEDVYPTLFGPLPDTVIPISIETLRAILGYEKDIDEAWRHFGVIEFEPNFQHEDWIYVTSAFSQPWKAESEKDFDPNGYSGYGYEMLLRTSERAGWAVDVLHRLTAYQIGVYNERMKGKLFQWGDWMPLNGPLNPKISDSPVRGMFLTRPRDFAARFELPSGQVDLLQIVGITGPELAYGLYKGFDKLENKLFEAKAAPTTNPSRQSIELPAQYPLPAQLAERF